jgi:large subunit ribosomal protein L17
MKHGFSLPKLNRTENQRWRMIKQLVTHLFDHERIQTTYTRAMMLRRYAERAISMAKRGSDHATIKVANLINVPVYHALNLFLEAYSHIQGIDRICKSLQEPPRRVHACLEGRLLK